jgi:hypothetical protein
MLVARRSWSRRSVATWNCTQSPCLFQNSKLCLFSANCTQIHMCFKMIHTSVYNNSIQVECMNITCCNGQAWTRHAGGPSRLIIQRLLKQIFFKLSRPRMGLAKRFWVCVSKLQMSFRELLLHVETWVY